MLDENTQQIFNSFSLINNSNNIKKNYFNILNFVSFNIRGINDPAKSAFLKDYLEKKNISICFLQETHLDSISRIDDLEVLFSNYFCFFTTNKIKTRGVGILIKKNIQNFNILNKVFDIESRFLSIEVEYLDKKINFINIYAPNHENEQITFVNNLYNLCSSAKIIFLSGYFNAVTNSKDRISPNYSKGLKNYEIEWVKFFKNFKIKEVLYEENLSQEQKMTWGNNGCFSKIDRIYVSDQLFDYVKYTDIFETTRSDHKAIHASVGIKTNKKNNKKKKFYNPWKLNESILSDSEVVIGLKIIFSEIILFKKKYGKLWYDFFIDKVIQFLKKMSRKLSDTKKMLEREIFYQLEHFNRSVYETDQEYEEAKHLISEKLNSHYLSKEKSLKKKLRDDRMKFIKHPTKILIENIVKKQSKNELNTFVCSNNTITKDSDEIINDINKYYIDLLGEETITDGTLLNYEFSMRKINGVIKESFPNINDKISYSEAYQVIMDMEESAPGSNGLTIGFFKTCFPYFGEAFVEILNDDEGILPQTFNESIIKLIPKNDKKVKGINDLRPISLTNFEYRIYTKILANRFNKLGPSLFSDCQTCSVKGRRINDSINTIKDVIEDANMKMIETYIISIDQSKAFDRMSHKYLFYLLDFIEFGRFLINSVKRIYGQSYAYICVNRILSKTKIIIRRGIKQGCALSMFLYTTGIEELLVRISKNEKIIGYTVPSTIPRTIKSTGYADDIGGLLRTLESLGFFFQEFKNWGKISGASVNEDKTKILAINSEYNEYNRVKFVDKVKMVLPKRI